MHTPRLFLVPLCLLVAAVALTAAPAVAAPAATDATLEPAAPPAGDGPWVLRTYGELDAATVEALARRFDHLGVYREKGMLLVHADRREDWEALTAAGLAVEIDRPRTERVRDLLGYQAMGLELDTIPGFDCYRTVEETLTTGAALAAEHPDLAEWIDIGDSWQKLNPGPGVDPGWDIMVLRLTNESLPGDKPALLVLGSNHAREYTTAELVTRFGEMLLDRYGSDPEVTWLLDHHEIHLILVYNPDGRKQAETGDGNARKNRNNDHCTGSNLRGIDLNRNCDWHWGNSVCNGSSSSSCSLTFHGSAAGSEPETQALQSYMQAIFPDSRVDDNTSPAPLTAEGILIDVHSFGEVVLTSWGCVGTLGPPPNSQGIRTLARKIAFFPGYGDLLGSTGTVDGSTKDYSYGRLGVPGYTVEVGTSFFEGCTYFQSAILEGNLEALLQAAKHVRAPYVTPSGPDTVDPAAPPLPIEIGTPAAVTATVDDSRYNTGAEPVQTVAAAEVYVDQPPWQGGTPVTLAATDGSFDETVEAVDGSVATAGLAAGRHLLYFRGQDAAGTFGAVSGRFLYLIDAASSPTLQGTVTAAGSGAPLGGQVQIGPFTVDTDPGTGAYSLQLPSGTYDVTASAGGFAPATSAGLVLTDFATVTRDFELSPRTAVFTDDVEGGNAGWTADPPWAITTEAANSPTSSWTDSPGGNYLANRDVSLTSPPLDLTGMSGTRLSFRHIYDFEPSFDGGWVEVSTDGTTWTPVEVYAQANQTAVWELVEVDLPMLDGAPAARVRFRLRSDGGLQRDGWHLDDLLIEAASTLIFADGFESGDTTAWSATTP